MIFVNLTSHAIKFLNSDGSINRIIKPSGKVAKIKNQTKLIGDIDGIPLTKTECVSITGLPEPERNTIYIVPKIVAQACPNRKDVFVPNQSVRDKKGNVIGCRSISYIFELDQAKTMFLNEFDKSMKAVGL